MAKLSAVRGIIWNYLPKPALYSWRELSNAASAIKKPEPTNLARQLRARIVTSGPITVADYMREVLTNPVGGYYMHRDVFGSSGDFITSPEISQIFGELLGIWIVNEWQKCGSPRPFQLVELGPGRGSLAEDVLRVFRQFVRPMSDIHLHLVEISPHLKKLQCKRLCEDTVTSEGEEESFSQRSTNFGCQVSWHSHLQEVPSGFSCFIAHEFFDALPIHKLIRTPEGWRELLVDLDADKGPYCFRFVLARGPTPASKMFVQADETRDHIEVSPQTAVLVQELVTRIEEDGGFALVADYGHDGTKGDTFRAFREHKLHDPLEDPGTADLTADVDFSMLKKVAEKQGGLVFGPVDQRQFLHTMGIELRLKMLQQNCKDKSEEETLLSGYRQLVDEDKMGSRFNFICMFPHILEDHLKTFPVAGF